MKVLVPTESKERSDPVSEVFGRSKYFAIYDTEEENLEMHNNPGNSQPRGAGMTAAQFAIDENVRKVFTRQIGPNAESVLKSAEIEVEILEKKMNLDEVLKSI